MTSNLLTSSRLAEWQRCPRRHHYRYDVGLVQIGESPRALLFGTAMHAGLEHWWHAHADGASAYALSAAKDAAVTAYSSDDPYAVAMLVAMLHAYDARWSEWAQTVEVIGVEMPFETALCHPVTGVEHQRWTLGGKIDAMLRLSDGRVAIMEHKTSSMDVSAGSDYRRALTLNAQVGIYFEGASALGVPADVCIYDMLHKPAIKPLAATPEEDRKYTQPKSRACKECRKKNSAPMPHIEDGIACVDGRIVTDPGGTLYAAQRDRDETPVEYEARLCESLIAEPDRYLVHAEIVRSDGEMEGLRWDLWHAVRMIEETRDAALKARDVRAVPHHAGACMSHGSPCAYLPVCEGTASARDVTRYQRLDNPHVELSKREGESK